MMPKFETIQMIIERIGYPIVVSGALFYLIFVGLEKQEKAMLKLTDSVQQMSMSLSENNKLMYRALRRKGVPVPTPTTHDLPSVQ